MKIAYALTGYVPSTGGAQIHFHEIARRLSVTQEVRVFCHWKENRTDWLRGVTVRAPGDSEYVQDGVAVTQFNLDPSDRRRLAFWAWGYYAAMGASVAHIAGALEEKMDRLLGPVDLIHAGRMGREFLAWAALRTARRRKIPFVFTPFHHPQWSGWRWRWYLKLYREADALIALTRAEKEILAGLGVARERIHVIGHAPVLGDVKQVPDYFGPGGPVVLFLGQKYAYKGVAQLLAAMPRVWARRPDVRFAFLGPRTPYSEKLFKTISDPRVIEKDRVPEADKQSALAQCAVFCLPSRQESFGSVFVEAWRFGKPVVGGNIPAAAELIEPGINGSLVGETPEELALALLTLLQDPDQARRFGAAGRQRVAEKYTWDAVLGALSRVYRSIK